MPTYIMLVNFTDQGRKGVKEVPNRQDKSDGELGKAHGAADSYMWYRLLSSDSAHPSLSALSRYFVRQPKLRKPKPCA
jgi:hypothetical protein